jgi:hypothetical protein
MTPDAVKSIGGVCQLAGVVLVVRDLVSIHEYKGDVTRLRASVGRTLKGFGEALRKALMGGPASHQGGSSVRVAVVAFLPLRLRQRC